MRNILIGFILLITTQSLTQSPSGDDVLKRLDQNMTSNSKVVVSKMIIHGRRGSRTIESKSWIQGTDQSFTEYLAPAREKGTKMLKLGDQLWTYSPSTDRTIRIAGHMLRQSVMGSDLSYEDMMEDPELHKIYSANIIKEEILNDRVCWILELIAKKEDVAYHSRKLWVDKDRFVALKETRYAKSGKLLKTTEIKEVKKIENRWVPMRIVFKDELKSGDGTEFIVDSIEFDVAIPDYIFSKATLRR
jgi:outer membrane lipoprotein-sorting protein